MQHTCTFRCHLKHFTSRSTSTPSVFDVITVNAPYKLLSYLLTRWLARMHVTLAVYCHFVCVSRGRCMELMSHWQFIGVEKHDIGQRCLAALRNLEDGNFWILWISLWWNSLHTVCHSHHSYHPSLHHSSFPTSKLFFLKSYLSIR